MSADLFTGKESTEAALFDFVKSRTVHVLEKFKDCPLTADLKEDIIAELTKPGNIFHLSTPDSASAPDSAVAFIGPHRLYLGDAYAIRPTLGWMDCDCMDPPYLFKAVGAGKMRKARYATNMLIAEKLDQGFNHSIINPLRAGMVIVFCHNDQIPELGTYLKARFKRFILGGWAKDNPMPVANKHFLYDTDYFYVAWNKGHHPVGAFPDKRRFIPAPVASSRIYDHGSVKPDKVMDRLMRNIAGQTVCDPFMGTGSTGVAAIRAGKTFTGIEHNPKHFETAVRRISAAYEEGKRT